LEELKAAEHLYRNSVPDITHNHIRLLYSGELWSTIFDSAATGWKLRNLADEACTQKLRKSKALTLLFSLIGLIPLLGRRIRRVWGRPDWRTHYRNMLTSWDYFLQALRAGVAEKVITWHRAGRVSADRAMKLAESPPRFFCHLPFSIFPAGLHRFLTDWQSFKDKLHYVFVRPFKLYFSARLREQWLRGMVQEGRKNHFLTDEDADTILSQLRERYIQRYLISLVVHLLTLPVTQIVFGIIGVYVAKKTGSTVAGIATFSIGQIIPISPGSLCRGLWAVGIAVYDRSFKDYNIAVFLSFVKYIGYLAFPIQMTYHYPALARFMAAHWATQTVNIVPVFGERGALLEHWVFRLFYNWPLTIRRRMRKRAQLRAAMKPRYWHVALCAVAAAAIFGAADFAYLANEQSLPRLRDIWWLSALIPLVSGAIVTLGCGGAELWKRIVAGAVCGIAAGVLYTAATAALASGDLQFQMSTITRSLPWRIFVFAIVSTSGVVLTELMLPDPEIDYLPPASPAV
ncbi:MAG: hypothetical protein ACYTEQ_07545, partial [Planctomycetota bacterium]|jgi:hypothetical protein